MIAGEVGAVAGDYAEIDQGADLQGGIPGGAGKRQRAVEMHFGLPGVAADPFVKSQPAQGHCPEPVRASGEVGAAREPTGAFPDQTSAHPVRARLAGDAQGDVGIPTIDRPGERGPQVVDVGVHPVQPTAFVGSRLVGGHGRGQTSDVLGVYPARRGRFAMSIEQSGGECANRFEHQEARFVVRTILAPDQSMVEERHHRIEDGGGQRRGAEGDSLRAVGDTAVAVRGSGGDERGAFVVLLSPSPPQSVSFVPLRAIALSPCNGLDRVQGSAAGEDREAAEDGLIGGREQVVGPGDGRLHRLVAIRGILGTAGQDLEPVGEAGQQGGRRQDLGPGGGQLDRQRQAIEPRADLGDRRHRLGGDHQIGLGCPRPVDKERFGVGGEGRHRELVLPADPEADPAGGQDGERRAALQEVGRQRRDPREMLQVVEDQQGGARREGRRDRVGGGLPRRFAHAQRLGDGAGRRGRDR